MWQGTLLDRRRKSQSLLNEVFFPISTRKKKQKKWGRNPF
ncbi:hypothetical protein A45J_2066 [hot springs metagenome]|uniref:Uncharacterized protein n=1 Tax=hot springs metagenome TaxID=433727 RepID=A0A5J4L263_9ZZZZ